MSGIAQFLVKLIKRFRYWLLIIPVLCMHLLALTGMQECVFQCYYNMLFIPLRNVYDYTLGWSPVPFIYTIVLIIVFIRIRKIRIRYYHEERRNKNVSTGNRILKSIRLVLNAIALFYLLWGFNYYRIPMADSLGWSAMEVDSMKLINEFNEVSQQIQQQRMRLSHDTTAYIYQPDMVVLEDSIRNRLIQVFDAFSLPHPGRVRVRALQPQGSLLVFSTAGIYIPYTMEGHFDKGLHTLQWPFTMAHEMSHGYGITDEGECNLLGLLACLRSSDDYIRYSGLLGYWRYLYYEVSLCYYGYAEQVHANLSKSVRADLNAVRLNLDRYPELFPEIRDYIYNSYLEVHGVESGLDSYQHLVPLMLYYKQHYKNSY